MFSARYVGAAIAAVMFGACSSASKPPDNGVWTIVEQDLPGALLSLWGTSASNIWTVGGDARDGSGPLVMHYDGSSWKRLATGETKGDLWWVFGFAGGPIFMGGAGGVILRYEHGAFARMTTPGDGTVFGIWGSSPTDVWAVGGRFETQGFVWRLRGGSWTPEPSLPVSVVADASIWKACGRSANDIWLVGSKGVSFHWNGFALEQQTTGVGKSLFTVHANSDRVAAVGGDASGIIVENHGAGWKMAGTATYGLAGVALGPDGSGYAVGQYASVYARDDTGWHEEKTQLSFRQDLHGVWIDPDGGVWAVGGKTFSTPLTEGVLLHRQGK